MFLVSMLYQQIGVVHDGKLPLPGSNYTRKLFTKLQI